MFVNQKCENDFVEPRLGNKKCFYYLEFVFTRVRLGVSFEDVFSVFTGMIVGLFDEKKREKKPEENIKMI